MWVAHIYTGCGVDSSTGQDAHGCCWLHRRPGLVSVLLGVLSCTSSLPKPHRPLTMLTQLSSWEEPPRGSHAAEWLLHTVHVLGRILITCPSSPGAFLWGGGMVSCPSALGTPRLPTSSPVDRRVGPPALMCFSLTIMGLRSPCVPVNCPLL